MAGRVDRDHPHIPECGKRQGDRDGPSTDAVAVSSILRKAILRMVIGQAVFAGLLFGAAGGLDWGMAWVLLGVTTACLCLNLAVLMRANPALIVLRLQGMKGAERWDVALVSILTVLVLLTLFVAGLDKRMGWSVPTPVWLQLVGIPVFVLGDLLFLWAMAVNRFFAGSVRIQREQGHRVVSAGLYRYVRHPGYVGWFLFWTGMVLMLGSPQALALAMLPNVVIVVRTALEDRMLHSGLDGYSDYAKQVRYRLVPGVW